MTLARDRVAEADGNRTRLAGMPDHYGFEDRARHQTSYASAATLVGSGPGIGARDRGLGSGPGLGTGSGRPLE